ncbi:LacI family DNA-binding transcriptional regulator [Streptacidiphilus sp. N1-12]|uniref:LacI family DNA-binding transcriptional regulator n=2 Tax=Streptacidiphilus alkalitolerans TaxID=3342712 RepID=A0ABV6WX78_9ACTN
MERTVMVTETARPTLAEVARRAGVSTATASRVLNRSAKVSAAALARVESAVTELGYVRHRAHHAHNVPGRAAGAIAVVVFEDMIHYQSDLFYSRLLLGVERALQSADRELVVLTASRRSQRPTLVRYLCGGHVDGILLVGPWGGDALPRLIQAAGVPVVSVGRFSGAGDIPSVDADNHGGAVLAVRHLLNSGRRAIGTIAGPPDMAVGADRLAGYRRAISEADTPVPVREAVAYGDFTVASGEHALLRLLDLRPDLDAVFAASDLMAAGALRALHRLGISVPDGVAVIGFDDDAVARRTRPQLSTVRQPVEEMGERAVAELLAAPVSGAGADGVTGAESGERVVMATQLLLRESG